MYHGLRDQAMTIYTVMSHVSVRSTNLTGDLFVDFPSLHGGMLMRRDGWGGWADDARV